MAKTINPAKLLPSSKSSAIVRVGNPKSVKVITKTSSLYKGLVLSKPQKEQSKDATDTNNKLVKVDKFLKSDLIVSQKKAEVKRKEKEKQDFDEAEKKLELPKFKGFKLPGIAAPSLGFMDRVKRFLFFTALGWALPKILEFLPKLEGFANIIGGVYKFAEGLFGKLFDGFMSLVKFGGDLKDKTIGFIASAKAGLGGNYQKEFDKLEKQFNTFVNASIIAGVLAADIGSAAVDEYNKWRKKNVEPAKPKPGESTKPAVKAGTKVTTGQGGKPGLGKGAKVTGGPKPKPSLWGKLTGGLKSKLSGVAGKLSKPFSKFAGAAVPGLGAAIGFADAQARSKSGDKLGAFLAGLSASLDAFTAAVAVAGLASAATGVGLPAAAVLATAATAAGAISMSIDVVLLIRDILKAFGVPMFSRGGRIVSRYQGGGTTRGGKPTEGPKRRAITPTRRKPTKIQPPKSQPGKDVGGEKKIQTLYPDTDPKKLNVGQWMSGNFAGTFQQYLQLFGKADEKKPNPYKALTTTAKILKEIPLVGGIMGAAVDIALGQKPDARIYHSLSSGIGYLVESLANQKASTSVSSLMRDIQGFAEGGSIAPSRELRETYSSVSSSDLIAKVIGPTIDQRVNEAIQSIEKELQKRQEKKESEKQSEEGPSGDSFDLGPGGGDFSGNTRAMKAFNFFKSQGYTDYQAAGIVGNLLQENRAMDPTLVNRIGMKGIAQWDANRWSNLERFAASKKLDPNSFETQLQFIQKELKTGEGGLSEKTLKGTKSLEDAAVIFRKQYERPGEAEAMDQNRIKYARGVLSSSKSPSISGAVSGDYLKNLSKILPSITLGGQRYKASRDEGAREHAGRDYDLPTDGVFYSRLGGEVTFIGNDPNGYGRYIDIYNKDLNRTERIAEGTTILSGIKVGSTISPGQPVVQGTHQTGVIHYEIRKGKSTTYGVSGTEDPDAFLSSNNYKDYLQKVKGSIAQGQPTGRLTLQQVNDLQTKVANLKPEDNPIIIPGIGSISVEKGPRYATKRVYKNASGKEITQQQFNDLMIKYKLPAGSSNKPTENARGVADVYMGGNNMQGGGLIGPPRSKLPIPNSFTSYNQPSSTMIIARQQVIVEKPVYSGGGNKMIVFPVPVAVNSNIDLSLSRG